MSCYGQTDQEAKEHDFDECECCDLVGLEINNSLMHSVLFDRIIDLANDKNFQTLKTLFGVKSSFSFEYDPPGSLIPLYIQKASFLI